jgi:hypothetical protein
MDPEKGFGVQAFLRSAREGVESKVDQVVAGSEVDGFEDWLLVPENWSVAPRNSSRIAGERERE